MIDRYIYFHAPVYDATVTSCLPWIALDRTASLSLLPLCQLRHPLAKQLEPNIALKIEKKHTAIFTLRAAGGVIKNTQENVVHIEYLGVSEDLCKCFLVQPAFTRLPVLNFSSTFTVKRIGQSVISSGPEQHNFICKARHGE